MTKASNNKRYKKKSNSRPNNIVAMSKHNKKVRDRANAKSRLDVYIQTVFDMVDDDYVFINQSDSDDMDSVECNKSIDTQVTESESDDDSYYNFDYEDDYWCYDKNDIYFENNPWFEWTVKSVIQNVFN
jgi:hypothetical protein